MKKFLEYVAEDLLDKYGTDLSRIAIVFPNKRASMFLNEQLAIKAQKPIWAPSYMTISDFFQRQSTLDIGDPIKLVCDLHKSYSECTGIDETLDHFYGWGQLLLADFDDLDKNMAKVSDVFRNIRDIHELDDISYLDEEQKIILQKFFSNFSDDIESELKKRFLKLWCHFNDIYENYNKRLRKQNIAYEGMMYREVAQKDKLNIEHDLYIFVGFNVLQKVEQRVFSCLQKEKLARFYWDFDNYYMKKDSIISTITNEAGHYISKFIQTYPNELDNTDSDIYDCFGKNKNITYISASTENIQARYVNDWLKENNRLLKGKNTAIILCDESLLPNVIHYIPEQTESVNITTGFPLVQTPIASFVIKLFELRTAGFSSNKDTYRLKYVLGILKHPYAKDISDKCATLSDSLKKDKNYYPTIEQLSIDENLSHIFKSINDDKNITKWIVDILKTIARNIENEETNPLFKESLFRTYTLCNRINELVKTGDLDIDKITMQKLVTQLINSTNIPFHGEPAVGVQVMGILETRNLDFDNILILSCNEGKMPKGVNDSSFIPYSLRKAYELTTIDNKVAIYAYYFYNLIQRATDITIVYNKSTENGTTGEMSRFMLQLLVESNFDINKKVLQPKQELILKQPKSIKKDENIMGVLNSIKTISPTAINRYMRCPLQFYYNNILKIKEKEEFDDEGFDNRIFGNIFHLSAEYIYKGLIKTSQIIRTEDITNILKNKKLIERTVDYAFSKELFNRDLENENFVPKYNGLQIINREVIIKYITRLLEIDRKLTPFKIIDMENDVEGTISFKANGIEKSINIGGRIDRLDKVVDKKTGKERIRVLDYKTGRMPTKSVNSLDDIFSIPTDISKHSDYYLQAMLYSIIIKNSNIQDTPVSPALLFIQNYNEDDNDPTISINKKRIYDISEYESDFTTQLKDILSMIFNDKINFDPTQDNNNCNNCPYKDLCEI